MVDEIARQKEVQTAHTTFDILEILKNTDGANLSTVASQLDIAVSTAHRHLSTLVARNYVVKEKGEYYTSLKFLEFGTYASNRKPGYELATELVDQLAEETGEHSQLFVEEHGMGVYLYGKAGEHAVQSSPQLGKPLPLHATAAGKAILAHLSDSRIHNIIDQHGLSSLTENTITDEERLWEEIRTVRKRNYSVNREENHENLCAVGVPIKKDEDRVFGAVSLSGPTRRIQGDRLENELPTYLLGRANELELNIQFSQSSPNGAP
ncbi:IclR family transcriptional regulator [Natrialba sp. INN-245]|uniref:IclR family transcriptional regulator n=1 Tax=Natrialba sp. INN-245 TaxID=2690967 RepID=UPI00131169C0|nr:IclR family transcriptional regulator [Natrialba sp. INN-245]MWV38513.1 helix-turn-helix domain-containing protein [Natrialba sp. INN-245]